MTNDRTRRRPGPPDLTTNETSARNVTCARYPLARDRRARCYISPHWTLRGDIDYSSGAGSISSVAHRPPGPAATVPSTPTRSSLARSSSMSARNPIAAPGLSRAATVAHHRWPSYIRDEEDNSRSDSRRSWSRRDTSPSAPLYRSMAGSRRSSRTSLSESLADTDATFSTSEETPGKHIHPRHTSQNPPPPPRVPKPPKSCKGGIYEEDVGAGRRARRPRLRLEDTLLEEEEGRRSRSRSRPRREDLLYPGDLQRELQEQRPTPRRNDLVYEDDSEQEPLPTPRRGEVIYEEDVDVPPRYNPFRDGLTAPSRCHSRAPSRSASRPPSGRQARQPSVGREQRGSAAIDEHDSRSRSKQRLSKRYALDVIRVLVHNSIEPY